MRFLGFRARIFCAALPVFAFAVLAPPGLKGIDAFLSSPLGPGVLALAAVALGMSVEELGSIARIRQGIGIRLGVPFFLGAGALWAFILGAPNASLALFGWILFSIGFIPCLFIFRHDLALFKDPRHGQPIALMEIGDKYIRIRAQNDENAIRIPIRKIIAVVPVAGLNGRGAVITLKQKESLKGPVNELPWVEAGVREDSFVLTEHQLAMNAESFASKVAEHQRKAKPFE